MARWLAASSVFKGGTADAMILLGRRIRARSRIVSAEFLGQEAASGSPVEIECGAVGFVGQAFGQSIVLAFPAPGAPAPQSLDQMTRQGRFRSVCCDWSTFRFQFEIEA